MKEELKLKYRKMCNNVDEFYKFMDEWNRFLLANPGVSKEEKLKKLEIIREIEPNLFFIIQEDINNES